MEINKLIELYARGYDDLRAYVDDLPEGALDFKCGPDKWTIREILIHMADSEAHGHLRGKKIIVESGAKITAYDQDAWADKLGYNDMDHADALELFRLLRKNMVPILKKLPEETWHNYIMHPESGKITLQDWIQLYIDHVNNHIQQMNRNLYDFKKKTTNR
jgi:hypothetical protein